MVKVTGTNTRSTGSGAPGSTPEDGSDVTQQIDLSHDLLHKHMVKIISSAGFLSEFPNMKMVGDKEALEYMFEDEGEHGKALYAMFEHKSRNRQAGSKEIRTMFKGQDAVKQEYGTESSRQSFKAALITAFFCSTDARLQFIFNKLVIDDVGLPITLFMANMFLQKILKDRAASEGEEQLVYQERGFLLWKPSNFQVLIYLNCLQLAYNRDVGNAVLSDRLLKRKQSLRRGNKFSRRVAYIVQLVVRCWTKLARATGHRSCSRLILPYVYFCKRNVVFHPLESRDAGFGHQDLQRNFDHPTPTRV